MGTNKGNYRPILSLKWLPWQHPLSDRENRLKSIIYDRINLVKIGPVDPEITLLKSLFFKEKGRT